MKEIWKDIDWYRWDYQISNLWRVKSLKFWRKRILKAGNDGRWYLYVILTCDWIQLLKKIHKLVANYFITNLHNKPCVNHKNGIKHDNRIDNLEWCSQSENIQHAFDTWLKIWSMLWKFWKDHNRSKKVYQYSLDLEFIREWGNWCEIQRELWILQCSISQCCRWVIKTSSGYIWKYD